MQRIHPITRQRIQRFRSLRRGYYSALLLTALLVLAVLAELWINHRAIIVSDGERWYFPTYGQVIPGRQFGLDYDYETHYRELAKHYAADGNPHTWVLMPLIPWGPLENDLTEEAFPLIRPVSPSAICWARIPSVGMYWHAWSTGSAPPSCSPWHCWD